MILSFHNIFPARCFPLKPRSLRSDLTDFEVFQKSFFTVQARCVWVSPAAGGSFLRQEHLTRRRRRLERQLCEEMRRLRDWMNSRSLQLVQSNKCVIMNSHSYHDQYL